MTVNERFPSRLAAALVALAVFAAAAALGAAAKARALLRPPLWVDRDDRTIPEPKEREPSELYGIVYNSWLRHLNVEYKANLARRLPSLNVNAWDEVPDSTWFTNRIGRRPMSYEEIAAGIEGAPPGRPPWKVTRVRDEGYTPKLDIRDGDGRSYVLKFDLPTAPERNSAAERICTLIFHAAGYNVPHNSIAWFRPADLELDEKAYFRDPVGKRHPLTPEEMKRILEKLAAMPDGRYRGLASLLLPGKPVGRFFYYGRRKDDANDIIPHQLRRELRGMRVLASWVNHADVKDINALDVYLTLKDGRKFVKHYMLDFGSTMGSGDFINGPYRIGHEYIFDGSAIARSFYTLGFWQRPWDAHGSIKYPEVGYYAAELFEPAEWKPNYPNLAFEQMDDSDAYWGAKIVTAFTTGTIRRLVESGSYSRREVTDHVIDVLIRRRDAIGRYWLDRITPIEDLLVEDAGGRHRFRFRDLAIERHYVEPASRIYRFRVERLDGEILQEGAVRTPSAWLPEMSLADAAPPGAAFDRYGRLPLYRLLISTNRSDGDWARAFEAIIGLQQNKPGLQVLGWTHAP